MKKILVLAAMCAPIILFTQCAPKHVPKSDKPTSTTANEVTEMKAKYTETQIAEGKAIFVGYCQKCHQLYQPTDFSVKKWDKILPEMSQKAELSAEQAAKVRAWVVVNAKP